MAGIRSVFLLSLVAVLQCGCASDGLRAYTPRGLAANERVLQSLGIYADLPAYFIGVPNDTQEALREEALLLKQIIDSHVKLLLANPSFRSLCALLNTYFVSWERLVIVQRIDFSGDQYAFIAIASQKNGYRVVTNLQERASSGWWEEGLALRQILVRQGDIEQSMTAIDKARAALPEVLLWYECVDWPLYVLHDIRPNGQSFTFSISGWGEAPTQASWPKKPLAYSQAAQAIEKAKLIVPDTDPQIAELRAAGGAYADLLALVWESTIGKADLYIRGDLTWSESECHPPVEKPMPGQAKSGHALEMARFIE
jgi:hypothetical protein